MIAIGARLTYECLILRISAYRDRREAILANSAFGEGQP